MSGQQIIHNVRCHLKIKITYLNMFVKKIIMSCYNKS
jgi:hypothetical protein